MFRKLLELSVHTTLILLLVTNVVAQRPDTLWTKTYGGTLNDSGESVQETPDGGYIIGGNTSSSGAGDQDVYLIKTDADGDTVWVRTYGGAGFDYCMSLQITSGGGYVLAGGTESFGQGFCDIYFLRTDLNGDTVWTRTYGGTGDDHCRSVQKTFDGGYVIAGWTSSFGAANYDACLIKTDAAGDTLWTRIYGGLLQDHFRSVQQTADSGYIVAGYTSSFGAGGDDVYLMKTDSDGDTQWANTYGGTGLDWGASVEYASDGTYVIAGGTDSYGAGEWDVYLIKVDLGGDTVWTRTYGGSDYDLGWSVQETLDGGYIVAADTYISGGEISDVYLLKTDADGDTLWTQTYGGMLNDYSRSIQQTSSGGYIVAGFTESFGEGAWDVYLIRTSPDCASVESPDNFSHLTMSGGVPNPFARSTRISFYSTGRRQVAAAIYGVTGGLVAPILNETTAGGPHTVVWNGTDSYGRPVSPGIYFIRLQAGDQLATRKVVLVR